MLRPLPLFCLSAVLLARWRTRGSRRDSGRGGDADHHSRPALARLRRDGSAQPRQGEARRAHRPGDRLPQGRRLRRGRLARPAGVSLGAGRPRPREGEPDSRGEHPDRLDPHPQRSGLLRLPRRQGGAHRRPQVHGPGRDQGRRGRERGHRQARSRPRSRSPPARPRGRSPTTTTRPTSTTGG